MVRFIGLLGLLYALAITPRLQAQPFDTNLNGFMDDVEARLRAKSFPEAQEMANKFREQWDAQYIKVSDKYRLILQTNKLEAKGWKLFPDLVTYINAVMEIRKSSSRINIPADQFFAITESVIDHFPQEEVLNYLKTLEKFVQRGVLFETAAFRWQFTQLEPRLQYAALVDSSAWPPREYRSPILSFTKTDIIFQSRTDTTQISETRGYVDIFDRKFHGEGGRYDWRRLGLPPDSVYVELKDFTANLKVTFFEAPDVVFHYDGFLPKPVIGDLNENIRHYENVNDAEYPYFRSTQGIISIPEFAENMSYEGGFSMKGVTKVGSAIGDTLAKLHIYHARYQTEMLKLQSQEFQLNPEKMSTDEAIVTLYLPDRDSLFHRAMRLVYEVESKDLLLFINRKEKTSLQPIHSNYHQSNFYFDAIKMNPNRDTIAFTAFVAPEKKTFAIESEDYFRMDRFDEYRGVLRLNPIGAMYRYWADTRQREFTVTELLNHLKAPEEHDRFVTAMPKVAGAGFAEWDPELERIRLMPRALRWGMAAGKVKDYDALQLTSNIQTGGNNAEMNYLTKTVKLMGVPYFSFSDSVRVDVQPLDREVYMFKNRYLNFGGLMRAGVMDYVGSHIDQFQFQYDNFKVYCDSVDYIRFVTERHASRLGRPLQTKTKLEQALETLKIEGVNGAVYINRPDNKSGKVIHPEYPVFDCYSQSFKYWNDSTQWNNGVYVRDSFLFVLDPFVLDSLEDFDLRALEFLGTFEAVGIMPAWRDTLKPVRDNTYGVRQHTDQMADPSNTDSVAVPVYGGKGEFHNLVHVNQQAMWGEGQLFYLNTVAECDSFCFHFDSVFSATLTDNFYLREGAYQGADNPSVNVKRVKYIWYPHQDKLVLRSGQEPMELFNGQGVLRGELQVTPDGVQASGLLELDNVQIESDYLDFTQAGVEAQDGTFIVSDPDIPTKQHFRAENVAIAYDVNTHTSQFTSVASGRNNMSFPQQRWSTDLGTGTYDRNSGRLALVKKPTQPISRFASDDPYMYSLDFIADSAVYNLATEEVEIEGTDSILVADAIVYPYDGQVVIDKEGKLPRLSNARLRVNQDSRYHEFFDVSVTVKNGINYGASGKYAYKEFVGEQPGANIIEFSDIYVRKDTTSRGVGIIPESQNFFITNRVIFRDSVEMIPGSRFLRFSGEVKIQSDNPAFRNSWFTFQDTVNPDSVFIPFAGDNRLVAGIHFFPTYQLFYPTFLQERRNRKDEDVVTAEGYLTVDPQSLAFRIGSREKLEQSQYRGTTVAYNDSTRRITSTGLLNLPLNLPEESEASIRVAGSWSQLQGSDNAQTELFMTLDFGDFPKGALSTLASRVAGITATNEDINVADQLLLESAAEFTEDPESTEEKTINKLAQKLESLAFVRNFALAEAIDAPIVLSNVRFTFCDSAKTFYYGGPIGIVGLDGVSINKKVNAKMTYSFGRRMPNGKVRNDTLRMYLAFDADEFDWWYLEFSGDELRQLTTINAVNQDINQLAQKQAGKELKDGEIRWVLSTESRKQAFLQVFSRYLLSGCGQNEE